MLTAAMFDEFAAKVHDQTAGLVDLLVLINDQAPVLGDALAVQLDSLVRARIVTLVDGPRPDRTIEGPGIRRQEAP